MFSHPDLYDLLLVGSPVLLVIGAVSLDWRTRRGYGIALLAAALLGLTIWLDVAFEQALERAGSEEMGVGIAMVIFIFIGYYCMLVLLVGALVEAGMAQQWGWVVGLLVAALVPGVNMLENNTLHLSAQKTPISGSVELLSLILLPAFAVLAFGSFRIVRPAKPRAGAGGLPPDSLARQEAAL